MHVRHVSMIEHDGTLHSSLYITAVSYSTYMASNQHVVSLSSVACKIVFRRRHFLFSFRSDTLLHDVSLKQAPQSTLLHSIKVDEQTIGQTAAIFQF